MQKVAQKIVYLSDDFGRGGAGVIAYEEAYGVREARYDVSVITATEDRERAGESQEGGVRIIRLYSNYDLRFRSYVSLWNRNVVKEVEKILEKEKPDIVHAHNIHTHISYKALSIARKHAKQVFLTAHDAMLVHYGKFMPKGSLRAGGLKNLKEYGFRSNPFRTLVIRHYVKHLTKILAVSNALSELLVANGITNVEVLHNGIKDTWQSIDESKRAELVSKYNLSGKKVILFAGRISGLKGGKVLQKAFEKIQKDMPETRLLVVGKNGEPHEGIIYTGEIPREDMKYVYSVSDVVAVPSLYLDPFPTINLEAMASGKPVVGTSVGGTHEAVQDGETGYIVDPNTSELEKKLRELLRDKAKAERFGEKGRDRFLKHFTLETHIKALLAWYNT